MKWLTDTIAGRTILVLALGLGTVVALAQYLYQAGIDREITAGNVARQAERLLLVAHSLTALELEKRDDAAHRLSGGPVELHWGREPLAARGGTVDTVTALLRDQLLARNEKLANGALIIGSSRTAEPSHDTERTAEDPHTTLISMQLDDGSWLNVTLARGHAGGPPSPSLAISLALAALGVVAVAVLMSRWLTHPVERLAVGASRLFLTVEDTALPESGTREVRTLARALNDMQTRIRRLVDDRTQMLAAVSHDLRSPLTRLRLRVARMPDGDLRRRVEGDLEEMERMIDATLGFLRDDVAHEPFERVDVVAILESIAADAADAGQNVSLQAPRALVVSGRHLALKRALTNIVQNAVKYGGSASIAASMEGSKIHIFVRDEGPGLPADKLDTVFRPFFRMEESRSRETGGHGLGLTVARSILRAHGGDVVLSNGVPSGLEAHVILNNNEAANPNAGR
jgi:signal transduction histidine kinase